VIFDATDAGRVLEHKGDPQFSTLALNEQNDWLQLYELSTPTWAAT
jgi:hypothetical protein